MIRVAQAIAALLYDHDAVIVPGLGAFLCHAEGAKVNVITNEFEKPSATLEFDPQCREDNDLIVNLLMDQESISEDEAKQLVMAFVSDSFSKMRAGDIVSIPEVGELSFDENQEIVFTPVASNQFNGDAFGLDDFNPQPVYVSDNQENWKDRVAQQTKDLNTPMTVDHEKVNEEVYRRRRRRRAFWFTLLALLLLAGAFVLLCYLKVIPVELPFLKKPEVVAVESNTIKKAKMVPVVNTLKLEEIDSLARAIDSLVSDSLTDSISHNIGDQPIETLEQPSVVDSLKQEPVVESLLITPPSSVKVFIVGGCYSSLQNAETQVKEIRALGFDKSFVMKRGEKFFVCYGQYATTNDAKEELPLVRESNPKAWILVKN